MQLLAKYQFLARSFVSPWVSFLQLLCYRTVEPYFLGAPRLYVCDVIWIYDFSFYGPLIPFLGAIHLFMHENRTGPPMITAERDKRGQLKTRKKAPLPPPSCHFPEFGRLRSSSPALFSLLVYALSLQSCILPPKKERQF